MKNADCPCELLTPVEPSQVLDLLSNPRYAMQIKEDGLRLVVESHCGCFTGYDRKGQITSVPKEVQAEFNCVMDDSIVDGELLLLADGSHRYVIWDIMRWMGEDVREKPYCERLDILQAIGFDGVPTWYSEEEKRAALVALHDAGAEGVVFKDLLAVWQPGRAQQHFKLKFWESATCRVADKSVRADAREDKHSIALELLDSKGAWQAMGFVTIPNSWPLPALDSLVEVRYLYAQPDGLYQPVFSGIRTDLDEDSCTLAQLKWKAERDSYAALA